jgi:hypothetical protein
LLNQAGALGAVVGGWTVNGVFRAQSGIPFQVYSSACTSLTTQLSAICLPGLLPGASPYAQSVKNIDVSKPLLNFDSFEPPNSAAFYTGYGPRVEPFRQPSYRDYDMGVQKLVHLTERVTFQLRGDAFNIFNAHHFNTVGTSIQSSGLGGSAFDTDLASQTFGKWNGAVTSPRNIQVSGRISF